jgi:hypothetical protein
MKRSVNEVSARAMTDRLEAYLKAKHSLFVAVVSCYEIWPDLGERIGMLNLEAVRRLHAILDVA